MAFVKCNSCGALISEKAPYCSRCGAGAGAGAESTDSDAINAEESNDSADKVTLSPFKLSPFIINSPLAPSVRALLTRIVSMGRGSVYFVKIDNDGELAYGCVVWMSEGSFSFAKIVEGKFSDAMTIDVNGLVPRIIDDIKESGCTIEDIHVLLEHGLDTERYFFSGVNLKRNYSLVPKINLYSSSLQSRLRDYREFLALDKLLTIVNDCVRGSITISLPSDSSGQGSRFMEVSLIGPYLYKITDFHSSTRFCFGRGKAILHIADSIYKKNRTFDGVTLLACSAGVSGMYLINGRELVLINGVDLSRHVKAKVRQISSGVALDQPVRRSKKKLIVGIVFLAIFLHIVLCVFLYVLDIFFTQI